MAEVMEEACRMTNGAKRQRTDSAEQLQTVPAGVPSVQEDLATAHKVLQAYESPKQSNFRVSALLRFVRQNGTCGSIEAVNAEPHDANIRGAICAERAALCRFQHEEASAGAKIVRVVCVTDHDLPIFPGPLCREFLTSTCGSATQVIASGTKDSSSWEEKTLAELLPLASVYSGYDQGGIRSLSDSLSGKVKAPDNEKAKLAYDAAVAKAATQKRKTAVFPVLFGAAVCFQDGRVYATCELKGMEYGCTVDAVTLLLPELQRSQEESTSAPVCIVQADQFGVAHAPFAAARGLLVEHGFGDILVCAHLNGGNWSPLVAVKKTLPCYACGNIF